MRLKPIALMIVITGILINAAHGMFVRVSIQVDISNSNGCPVYAINDRPVTRPALTNLLGRLASLDKDQTIYLIVDKQVSALSLVSTISDIQNTGLHVVDEIIDVCSGGKSSKEREGLDKVFQLAHRKSYDVLIFWSLDRLSREGSRKTIAYLTILDDAGVAWHSFSEPYISSLGVFSDCIISLLSTLAKQERIRISERTKAGLERTVRVNGTRLGRPKTAPEKLQKALKLRNEGLSYAQIADKLGVSRIRAFQMVKGGRVN